MAPPTRPLLIHRLRVRMLGVAADVQREIWIDGSLPLGTLHRAITAAFERTAPPYREDEMRHLFTERAPEFPPEGEDGTGTAEFYDDDRDPSADPWFRGWRIDRLSWRYDWHHRSAPRRWGDRWTMIECHDPAVVDESTVTVGAALDAQHPLFYSVRIDNAWWFEIESVGIEMRHADAARIELVSGRGRAPLAICPDPATWNAWLRAMADPAHEDHVETLHRLEQALGPWTTFDPTEFDEQAARETVALSENPQPRGRGAWRILDTGSPLDGLLDSLPADARPGLRTHLAATAVRQPAAVPMSEATAQVAAFRSLVQQAAREPLSADAEEDDPVRIAARRLGLLYPRKGVLLATKKAREAAGDPLALRALMIHEILRRRAPAHPLGELFLLAIADGSIVDRERALAVATAAYDACASHNDYAWDHGYGATRSSLAVVRRRGSRSSAHSTRSSRCSRPSG